MENTQIEQKNEKKNQKELGYLRDLWNSIGRVIFRQGVPEGEEKEKENVIWKNNSWKSFLIFRKK